jgi:hypothetical protein
MRTGTQFVRIALALIALAAPLAAEPAGEPPEMTPEQQAMMDAMMKAATPGAEHAWLASLAGSWTFTGTSWMEPGGPGETFTGTAERTMIFGGRVLVEKVTSEFGGMPFEGMGMTGYDNVTQSWWGTWNDNMSTGMAISKGSCSAGKCEFTMTMPDAVTGKMSTGRVVAEHMADHEAHVMYAPGPDGKEFKVMEFHYSRKK